MLPELIVNNVLISSSAPLSSLLAVQKSNLICPNSEGPASTEQWTEL